MKKTLFLFLISSCIYAQVKTGIDNLVESDFSILKGKHIGLITNPTGINSKFISTVDLFANSETIKLVALYGPEHGVRGDVTAGGKVDTYTDSITGLPVYSLYGKTRKPTSEMLKGIEVLVYDIQDIGSRSYTYINTMAMAMEAAAENNIEFIVLDRPNPLSGNRVEGKVLDLNFRSFVGQYPIPYVYGMTCGEFAQMLNGEGWLEDGKICKLTIVKMKNWKRSMYWDDTKLPWVPTSPHIPNSLTALYYSAIGMLGELQTVNIGVGYTMPFQLVGALWINGRQFSETLNSKNITGVYFRPLSYKPFYGEQKDQQLQGVEIYFTDRTKVNLTELQIHIIETIIKIYPDKNPFALADQGRISMFDKVAGTDNIRTALMEGHSTKEIGASWKIDLEKFLLIRKKYLLYN